MLDVGYDGDEYHIHLPEIDADDDKIIGQSMPGFDVAAVQLQELLDFLPKFLRSYRFIFGAPAYVRYGTNLSLIALPAEGLSAVDGYSPEVVARSHVEKLDGALREFLASGLPIQ